MTREHYISRGVLDLIFTNRVDVISGTPWAPKDAPASVRSLTGRILCQGHNNQLSRLDQEAKGLFLELQESQLSLASAAPVSHVCSIDGNLIERWLLKVLFGMLVSGNLAHEGEALPRNLPANWPLLLLGKEQIPESWGMYVLPPAGAFATAHQEFESTPLSGPDRVVRGAQFRLARIPFTLLLGKPDNPGAWGIRRPGYISLKNYVTRRIELRWPGLAGAGIELIRIADA